jgi:hypothetical protein
MSNVQATLTRQASKISDELFEPYKMAAQLLQDDQLVWDEDFNQIRNALALALTECATTHNLNPWFLEVAYRLIDTTRADA